jgi:hypothetical protein
MLAPLSDNGLHYSALQLAILNGLAVTYLYHIDTTTLQGLPLVLKASVVLLQYLLAYPPLTTPTMIVDHDSLREQGD